MADKRRIRGRAGFSGSNFTPQEAKRALTLPVYAILTGQAHPEFVGGNLASPSKLVAVRANHGGCVRSPDGRGIGLPVWLNGKQWNTAVLPILESPLWISSDSVVGTYNWPYLLEALGNALAKSFSDAGYGPVDR